MDPYQVSFVRSARKELLVLPLVVSERVLKKIEALEKEPRPSGCLKLRGPMNLWRIRVGEYRIVYQIDDEKKIIDIMIVRHRSDAYR